MSSSFMKSAVYDCVCWLVSLCTSVHKTCDHAGVDEGAHGNWHTGLLCCVLMWPSLCAHKHRLTPLRSETDKKGHEITFPHSDVTACENPVTNQILSDYSEFLSISIFGSFALPTPLSPIPTHQTLSCVTDTCWASIRVNTAGRNSCKHGNSIRAKPKKILALVYAVSTSPSLMKLQFSCNTVECFCFLSGCCCFDPCRPYWLLVLLVLHQLKLI